MAKRLVLAVLLLAIFAPRATAQVLPTSPKNITAISGGGTCNSPDTACATYTFGESPSITFDISGTFTGTLTFEGTSNGTTWRTISVTKLSDGTTATTATAAGQFSATNAGLLRVRVRATAWTSGMAVVFGTGGTATAKILSPTVSSITVNVNDIQTTSTDGAVVQNTTAATALVPVQFSPRLKFCGSAWKSDAVAASQTDCWIIEDRPLNGTSTTTSNLRFSANIDGGAFSEAVSFTNGGNINAIGNVVAGSAAGLGFQSRTVLFSASDGVLRVSNNAGTDFTRLQFGGTSSSFPALGRSGTGLVLQLADGTAGTGFFTAPNFQSNVNGGGYYLGSSRGSFTATADGVFLFTDNASTAFTRLMLGGTTSSYPAIKRNSAALNFRLADDSADAAITTAAIGASGTITETRDGIASTTTDGLLLTNNTAATAGVTRQKAPQIRFFGNVWNSTSGTSNTDEWRIEAVPTTGTTPTSILQFCSNRNSGGDVCGQIQTTAAANWFFQAPATGLFTFSSRGGIQMPADGELDTFDSGGTFNAGVREKFVVEANTGSKSPTARENNEVYTNTGDTDGSSITLLNDPNIGSVIHVAVTVAQTITISPSAGESLYLGSSVCNTSITSNVIGSTITIFAATAGSGALWMSKGPTGTWVCNP